MEPSMDNIDDFNGNESNEKSKLVYGIIGTLLVISIVFTVVVNLL